ncbi:acetyl-CoA carboxylase biotin carboxyl carrier protein [bacterium]|nr:acetyl-CoA carboxylase biotin carboxyl carrier protein [bacterium]
MDIKKVRELVKLVEESGIEELEVSHQDTTVRIQKSAAHTYGAPTMMPAPVQVPLPAVAAPVAAAPAVAEAPAAPAADATRGKWKDVRSPIVGTFYRSPSPTSPAFVSVGDHVAAGQTLCIIEAMKVMNEIEAEFGGTIKEILLEDGGPVEAEAVLFLVDPD